MWLRIVDSFMNKININILNYKIELLFRLKIFLIIGEIEVFLEMNQNKRDY